MILHDSRFVYILTFTPICNTKPIKIPGNFFFFRNKVVLKYTWKCKRLRKAWTVLEKNVVDGFRLPVFKTYYEVTIIKTVQYWHKKRHICHWNTTVSRCQGNTMEKKSNYQKIVLEHQAILTWEGWGMTLHRLYAKINLK